MSSTRSTKQLEATKSRLIKEVQTIKESNYPAKPSEHTCSFCEYKRLCPFAKK